MRTDSRFSGVSAGLLIKKHSTQSEILCNSSGPAQGLFISWNRAGWAVCGQKKPPGDGGKQKITCMNSLDNVSESNFAASRPEKQFTRDAVRRLWRVKRGQGILMPLKRKNAPERVLGALKSIFDYHRAMRSVFGGLPYDWGGRARRSPSDRTLVSERARKRKWTGNYIEHVRTDVAKKGPPIFWGRKNKTMFSLYDCTSCIHPSRWT